MSEKPVPAYRFMDNFNEIYSKCADDETKQMMLNLRDTILYQMEVIRKQRSEIIYVKHRYVWKQYDREDQQ